MKVRHCIVFVLVHKGVLRLNYAYVFRAAIPKGGGGGGGSGAFFFKFPKKTCFCFIVFLYMSAGCVSTIRTLRTNLLALHILLHTFMSHFVIDFLSI